MTRERASEEFWFGQELQTTFYKAAAWGGLGVLAQKYMGLTMVNYSLVSIMWLLVFILLFVVVEYGA